MKLALRALTEQIQQARATGQALRIRGGGSKDFYCPGGQPLQGGVLDTTGLTGIISYEPSELYIRAHAGTSLAEMEAALAASQQFLPFEPPHFSPAATLGGMVAAGLSGPARASAGSVRDHVLGLSLLNGRAEHLTFGGQVMKNVAGYDVSRLMAGSLGMLGLITEVSLKVLPLPVAETTLQFELSEAAAIAQLNRWAGQPLPLNASCWFNGSLRVRLRGAQAAVAAAQRSMGGDGVASVAEARQFWASLREQTHTFFALQPGESLWRLSLPDTAPPQNLGPTLVEWGGAQRWFKTSGESVPNWPTAFARSIGNAMLFRANGLPTQAPTPLSAPLQRIHCELKKEFDPAGIFNPGRLITDL